MTSMIDRVIGERAARRRTAATVRVETLLRRLRREGTDVTVIGSLAAGRFKAHSDVDLLVRGNLDTERRANIERAVADAMRGSGIPYDLIYAADLAPDRLEEFERDLL